MYRSSELALLSMNNSYKHIKENDSKTSQIQLVQVVDRRKNAHTREESELFEASDICTTGFTHGMGGAQHDPYIFENFSFS